MANARMTAGSLLGAVTTAANAVGETFNAVGTTIGMASSWANNAAETQRKRYALESATRDERLIIDASRNEADLKVEVEKLCSTDPTFANHFNSAYQKYSAILNGNPQS